VGHRLVQPELLFWDGRMQTGLALELDSAGMVTGARPPQGGEAVEALAGRALLPGLVNAHSHAFQRLIRGRTEYVARDRQSDDFWSWRELMYRAAGALGPEDVFVASRQAFLEMALLGITAVGEFHYLHHAPDGTPYSDRLELSHQVIRAAREVGLRVALLRVGYARGGANRPLHPSQRRFVDPTPDRFLQDVTALRARYHGDPGVSVAAAPHSVRAVPREWLQAVAEAGKELTVHMHVAEQPAEVSACRAEYGRSPVQLLDEAGLLRRGVTLVHAVHVNGLEIRRLGQSGVTVCACPSTERNLGDGVVLADELMRASVPICLGTDSHAQMDLLDEARQLEGHLRLLRLRRAVLDPGGGAVDGLARRLLDAATAAGTRSLGLPGGTLAPGAPADFFTVDLEHPALVGSSPESLVPALVLGGAPGAVRDVAVGGQWIVRDGQHRLQRESGEAFRRLAQRVFQ
jgi:formimidoylglutamate deiminase